MEMEMKELISSSSMLQDKMHTCDGNIKSYREIFEQAYESWMRKDYTNSFPLFKFLVESGYAHAYGYLGIAYELGQGVECDAQRAESLYNYAIEAHDHVGVYRLGWMYKRYGLDSQAREVYQRAIDGGFATSDDYYEVAEMLKTGSGGVKDIRRAIEYYRIVVKRGDDDFRVRDSVEALQQLGVFYDETNFNVSLPEELAEANADKLYSIGKEKLNDWPKPDIPFAFACFFAAAKMNHALAAYEISVIYGNQVYPIFDQDKSIAYAKMAAAGMVDLVQQDVTYANDAGRAYLSDCRCLKDEEKAQFCFELGSSAGDMNCQWGLGLLYKKNGDDERAVHKFWEAAEQGHGMAMYELAQCYELGIGTPCDIAQAILWYKRCKVSSYTAAAEAKRRLQKIERECPNSLDSGEKKNVSHWVRSFFRSLFK